MLTLSTPMRSPVAPFQDQRADEVRRCPIGCRRFYFTLDDRQSDIWIAEVAR